MIVDCADTDAEMATDPFLEAGIDIPKELPYQTPVVKKKLSIIKRRNSKMNEPSPANSCISLARSSSNAMQININQLKNFHKKLPSSRRRKSATSAKSSDLCLEIGDIPKHFYDLSSTAPVVTCEKSNGTLQFQFQKVQGDLKRSQSDAPSIVIIKTLPNVGQSENKSETIKVSKAPRKTPPLLKKRVSSILEESEEDANGEKNVEVDIETDNSSKGSLPKSPSMLKKKVIAISEGNEKEGDAEIHVKVGIESNDLHINQGFEDG